MNLNRLILKNLNSLTLDSQFATDLGGRIFTYKGEANEDFRKAVKEFKEVVEDLSLSLEIIKGKINETKNI